MDADIDEMAIHADSLSLSETDIMSPDSNHNSQLSCNELATATTTTVAINAKIARLRNGTVGNDHQKAVREALEAMESIKSVNGAVRHLDDSFDNDSQDDLQSSSHKYYAVDTPSSDLVIDERSVDDGYMEQPDSPEATSLESFRKSPDDEGFNSDNGEFYELEVSCYRA